MYKELRKGIYQLKPMNKKGEYANINTNNGTIVYYKKVTSMPMSACKMTIRELEAEINKGNARWLKKEYIGFMTTMKDVYNDMVDRINHGVISM